MVSEAHRTSAWSKARAKVKPMLSAQIASGQGWCFDGRHPIQPGEAWDVSHLVSVQAMKAAGVPEREWHRADNLTSSHVRCNRSKGGSAGAKAMHQTRKAETRVLAW